MAMVEWKGRTRALCISFSPEQLLYACIAGFSSTWDRYTAAHACRALAGGGDTLLLLYWFASPRLAPLGSSTGRVNSAFSSTEHSGVDLFLLNLNMMARSVCPETRLVVQVALGCLSVWLQKIQRSPCCVRWVRCILACDATGLGWVTQPGRQMWHIIKWTLSKWHLNKYLCKMTPDLSDTICGLLFHCFTASSSISFFSSTLSKENRRWYTRVF